MDLSIGTEEHIQEWGPHKRTIDKVITRENGHLWKIGNAWTPKSDHSRKSGGAGTGGQYVSERLGGSEALV